MLELIMHPTTAQALQNYLNSPSQALLITGTAGSGKEAAARYLAAQLLAIDIVKLDSHPYVTILRPGETRSISIEAVRELQKALTLKIPGGAATARIVIITDGHTMTAEAQNALLKTIEEPPADTVIILTAVSQDAVLPTIQSRVQALPIIPPDAAMLKAGLQDKGYTEKAIETALQLSGNLPGLTIAMLDTDQSHPLYGATMEARRLLQSKAYERLILVDQLSKNKQLCLDIVYILGQMARTALSRTDGKPASDNTVQRWQHILVAAYEAGRRLQTNTQAKLVLTNLMLEL